MSESKKDEVLLPLYEAINTRSHVKISPSQASKILFLINDRSDDVSQADYWQGAYERMAARNIELSTKLIPYAGKDD